MSSLLIYHSSHEEIQERDDTHPFSLQGTQAKVWVGITVRTSALIAAVNINVFVNS